MGSLAARAHRDVNLGEFQTAGTPIDLGPLELQCPEERQYILRMAIRAKGGLIRLPSELEWVRPMLDVAQLHQALLDNDHPFVYVTVRHGLVSSETDDAWHVDGFSTKVAHHPEQNYIWTSRDGTEYADLSVKFPEDFDPLAQNVNDYLSRYVDDQAIQACQPQTIYCLDPYMIHRRPQSTAGLMRTFVRISFVPIQINDVNNTQNSLLPQQYDHDGVAHRNTLSSYPG